MDDMKANYAKGLAIGEEGVARVAGYGAGKYEVDVFCFWPMLLREIKDIIQNRF